jgi:aminoglycoside phosphotransferase (APT) family kinase protein
LSARRSTSNQPRCAAFLNCIFPNYSGHCVLISRTEQFSGTTEVRPQHHIDKAALDAYMRVHVEDYAGPMEIRQFKGGQSNPTYQLITPSQNYVLRRKPPGDLLQGAHAIEREYKVITALGQQSDVPVAKTYAFCEDASVIGTAFYIMDCVAGRVIWDTTFPDVPKAQRAHYFDAMNDTLAKLHSVDYAAIGLGDFGKPGNYFARQIARWSKQYLADDQAGRLPAMDKLVEWLPQHIPSSDDSSIVHGDFRCDNMIFHPQEPRVLAVLDWELCTIGHPLADFTYHLMMYRMPSIATTGLLGQDLQALGLPDEASYVQSYCARTGRDGIAASTLDFCLIYNMFRLAAIVHGIRGRVVRGTAASAHAIQMSQAVEPLSNLAWAQVEAAAWR